MSNHQKSKRFAIASLTLFFLLIMSWSALGLHINISESLPYGIYRSTDLNYQKGTIIRFCLDKDNAKLSLDREYVAASVNFSGCPYHHQALMKPIAGVAGDKLKIDNQQIWVNGKALPNVTILTYDGDNRAMPKVSLPEIIPPDHFLVIASYHPYSWDSRYYGLITKQQILGAVIPVWTW